jgi:hypothetical protein
VLKVYPYPLNERILLDQQLNYQNLINIEEMIHHTFLIRKSIEIAEEKNVNQTFFFKMFIMLCIFLN